MPNEAESYSAVTALAYVFNLIVGTGALALPSAFSKAGWLPGTILLILLGFISYLTVTFIIETLAVANAVGRQRTLQVQYEDEERPLLDSEAEFFEIRQKFEFIELATALLSRPARIAVTVCLIAYLFGDLAIYCAVVARTVTHMTSCVDPSNISSNASIPDSELCSTTVHWSSLDVYRLSVVLFAAILCPVVYVGLPKIKFLQMLTSMIRWLAFTIMIVWCFVKLCLDGPQGTHIVANFPAVPTLFGTCVYSFMCQHSIPGLVQPISNKKKFNKILPFNYAQIAGFYIFLSVTAVWTFSKVEDLYTLNFWSSDFYQESVPVIGLDYFLALFPVFTLTSSFPIIAITLRNNLKELLPQSVWINWILPIITCAVPAALALLIPDVSMLVGVVGSYAGTALQYVAPALLVSAARSRCPNTPDNPYKSPFTGNYWVIFIYVWSGLSITLITINHITMLTKL